MTTSGGRARKPFRSPSAERFFAVCDRGLSILYPFRSRGEDPEGWRYGSARLPSHGAFGRLRNLVTLAAVEALAPASMLEVAAGGGGLSAYMAARGCEVTANDLREEVLRGSLAEIEGGEKVRLRVGNILELDAAEVGQFELVVACEVIEHVAHPDQFLAKLKTFVKPGGHLLLTTPNGAYLRNRLPTFDEVEDFAALEAAQFQPDADGHLFLFTPEELTREAERAGLVTEAIHLNATPLVTGHAGFRLLLRASPRRLTWRLEEAALQLPLALRRKLTFSIFALFSVGEPQL